MRTGTRMMGARTALEGVDRALAVVRSPKQRPSHSMARLGIG